MTDFQSRDIALKVQKKILSSFSKKSVVKFFLDDTTSSLLDNLHRIFKEVHKHQSASNGTQNGSQNGHSKYSQPDKLLKNIIKIVIKLGVLRQHGNLDGQETVLLELAKATRYAALTFISFHEIDFTYDRTILAAKLQRLGTLLSDLLQGHVTGKTMVKLQAIFSHVSADKFLDDLFRAPSTSVLHRLREAVVQDLHKLLESNQL